MNFIIYIGIMVLFNFGSNSNLENWYIINDGVMGGKSKGFVEIDESGNGLFSGGVSLENNGGFTMLKYDINEHIELRNFNYFCLRLKGDGKSYQFRVKSTIDQRYSYVSSFMTTGEWEDIVIPFDQIRPAFRGNDLDLPNYSGEECAEIAFLIGNKTAENFKLQIDQIYMK